MPKKKIFRIGILVVSALVLVAAIILFVVSIMSMGYKKTVKSYCESLFTADFDTYWDTLSSLEYGGVDFDSRYDVLNSGSVMDYDQAIGYYSSLTESKTGEIKNITVTFDGEERLSDDDIEKIYDECVTDPGSAVTKLDDIKSGKKIDITVTIEGTDDTITFDINNLTVLKEGKEWRVLSIGSESDVAEKLTA